jgi:hypothetical protein
MAAVFRVSPGHDSFPVTLHYSILFLPPTLRAVRGCSLYVRNPINTLHLADFRRLSSGVPGQD